jgi:hypothetical protein
MPMKLQDYELYHGAVLTRLVRSGQFTTVRMIETNRKECWSAYVVDEDCAVYCKHRSHSDPERWGSDHIPITSAKWMFTFLPEHEEKLSELASRYSAYVALVCANHRLPDRLPDVVPMGNDDYSILHRCHDEWLEREHQLRKHFTGICLLEPDEWTHCLKQGGSIVVTLQRGQRFLVNSELKVPRNRTIRTHAQHA